MDGRTMRYQAPRARRATPVLVLEMEDVEWVEELADKRSRGHRFPPAMSDWELSQLVDACTSELCQLGAYPYGAYTG